MRNARHGMERTLLTSSLQQATVLLLPVHLPMNISAPSHAANANHSAQTPDAAKLGLRCFRHARLHELMQG